MNCNILFSIIIPIYKVEEYLPKCLDSIVKQSFKDIEVVLIDDGSPDHSGDICDEYAKKDSRIKVIHQNNAGVSAARSKGLESAKGQFVMFCDPDDYYTDTAFKECAKYISLSNNSYDIYCMGFKTIYPDGHETVKNIPEYKVYNRTNGLAMMDKLYIGGFVCNKIYRRSVIESRNISFNKKFKSHEDKLFFIDFISNVDCICLIPIAPYVYNVREGSLSFTFDNIKERVEALQSISRQVFSNFGGLARFWELGWTIDWLQKYYSLAFGEKTCYRYSDEEREIVGTFLKQQRSLYRKYRLYYYKSRIIEMITNKVKR